MWLMILLMLVATLGVAATSPQYLTAAFNPVTLNLSLATCRYHAARAQLHAHRNQLFARAARGRSMSCIYRKALGEQFQRLHPKIQERFGFSSADGVASIGTGTMDEIWHGPLYTMPFLYVGSELSVA